MIRLLVVEAQEITRHGLAAVLPSVEDLEVIAAVPHLADVAEQLTTLNLDVLLCDSADASELSKLFSLGIAIVIFSEQRDLQHVLDCLRSGASAYLLRSSSSEMMLSAIRAAAAGAAWLDPEIASQTLRGFGGQSFSTMTCKVPPKHGSQTSGQPKVYGTLSARESEILGMICEGYGNRQIAERLFLSKETVKTHVRHIMEKLQVTSRTNAAVMALRLGLVESNLNPAMDMAV